MRDGVFRDENSYFAETYALEQLVRLLLLLKQAINLQIRANDLSFFLGIKKEKENGKEKEKSYLKEAPVTLLRR